MSLLFETNRLLIREYQPTDLLSIHQYASQPLVVKYQNWGPNSLEDTRKFLQQVQQNSLLAPRMSYELCIERKDNRQPIGGCELTIHSDDPSMGTMGYVLNPLFWHQGYATEVSGGLLQFGVSQLGLHVIRATCDAQNVASIRVLEKSGFRLETTLVDDFMQKGKMRTTLVYTYNELATVW
ncbi:GNAT family N-acetyltransferase [Spirosoma sp. KNUC1025]|uniref:GNAT family N-acetyltransferase n=1 Tax=Spirosoma sp. KNUC1025 TaxID=2894082 RepID=UPI001E52A2AC|nr:GNAT family protein [Spirosoma sp. KNUC1025]UFH57787.1 GNAT family N-acetyltransferase [Spirosoma sp. KNUC1025]